MFPEFINFGNFWAYKFCHCWLQELLVSKWPVWRTVWNVQSPKWPIWSHSHPEQSLSKWPIWAPCGLFEPQVTLSNYSSYELPKCPTQSFQWSIRISKWPKWIYEGPCQPLNTQFEPWNGPHRTLIDSFEPPMFHIHSCVGLYTSKLLIQAFELPIVASEGPMFTSCGPQEPLSSSYKIRIGPSEPLCGPWEPPNGIYVAHINSRTTHMSVWMA